MLVVVPVAAAGLAVASAGAVAVGALAACVAAVADCLVHSSYCSILHPCVSTCVDVWVWCGPVLCPCGVWLSVSARVLCGCGCLLLLCLGGWWRVGLLLVACAPWDVSCCSRIRVGLGGGVGCLGVFLLSGFWRVGYVEGVTFAQELFCL